MKNGTYLSKKEILDADDLAREDVSVPEWGGTVQVREMTGLERQEFDATLYQIKQKISTGGPQGVMAPEFDVSVHADRVRVKLCSMTMIDEKGARLFTDAEVEKLGRKSDKALRRVYEVAARLSGIGAEAAKKLEGESEAAGAIASS